VGPSGHRRDLGREIYGARDKRTRFNLEKSKDVPDNLRHLYASPPSTTGRRSGQDREYRDRLKPHWSPPGQLCLMKDPGKGRAARVRSFTSSGAIICGGP
jgi:hypothetical protein